MMPRPFMLFAMICLAAPALAQSGKGKPDQPPATYQALMQCRAIADSAERLSCFDREAAAMQAAAERRDLVMVDRQQVRRTQRTLFGLALPDFDDIFGGGRDDEQEEDAVKSLETTVASARQDGSGNWIMRLAEGATWIQTDGKPLGRRPKAGSKIVINRAMMGSYIARIDGQAGVRVKRNQ